MKTKKIRTATLLLSIFFILLSLFSLPIQASEATETVDFTVSARLPQNQINSNVSYFDLRMQPDTTQILEVDVHNRSNAEILIEVEAITASTNRNGVIDYKTPNIKDETMPVVFSEIATPVEDTFTIPAYSSKTAKVEVNMPAEEFDGCVLGGILIRQVPAEKKEVASNSDTSINTSIENRYNYIIGVKLNETDEEIFPNFEVIEAKANLVNYHKAVTTRIHNTQPLIIKGMSVTVDIYAQNSDTILLSNTLTNIDMAPNSVLDFPNFLDSTKLKPGKYLSQIQLEYDNEIWNFEEPFEITATETSLWEIEAVDTGSNSIPWWAILLIVLAVLVLLFLIVLVFILIKKQNKGEPHEK